MKNESKLREWVTPLTIGAFSLSAATGIMLFFKVELSLVKPVHEWLSWLLVIGTALHLAVNWHPTVRYISKPIGAGILLIFLLLICVSFVPLGGGKRGGNPFIRITDNLAQAPLSTVAQVAKHGDQEVMDILKSQGIRAEGKDQTIREIATQNNKSPVEVLFVIF